jgi:hypothetical protein
VPSGLVTHSVRVRVLDDAGDHDGHGRITSYPMTTSRRKLCVGVGRCGEVPT